MSKNTKWINFRKLGIHDYANKIGNSTNRRKRHERKILRESMSNPHSENDDSPDIKQQINDELAEIHERMILIFNFNRNAVRAWH